MTTKQTGRPFLRSAVVARFERPYNEDIARALWRGHDKHPEASDDVKRAFGLDTSEAWLLLSFEVAPGERMAAELHRVRPPWPFGLLDTTR